MIIKLLIYALSTLITLYSIYLCIVFIFGIFLNNKKYEKAKQEDIAILIPCNNEERVISRLLNALIKQTYKKTKYKIFVIAHNCVDNTALIAKNNNITVIEYNDNKKRSKADALNYALKNIKENYDNKYKYITIFDADSIPNDNFLEEINNAMATGCDVASGWIRSANYNTNIISKLSSMLYSMTMNCNSLPHNYFGLPVNIYGSGVCVKYELIKEGLNTSTIVEDFEFITREVLNKRKFIFAPNAYLRIEMPTDLKTALNQRKRWAIGDTQCFKKYISKYIKSFKDLGISGLKQLIDLCLNPTLLLGSFGVVMCVIKSLIDNEWFIASKILFIECILFCLIYVFAATMTMRKEKIVINKNIDVIILMPLWFSASIIFAIESFFVTDIKFEKTTHLGVEDESNI